MASCSTTSFRAGRVIGFLALLLALHPALADEKSPVTYKQVQPIFAKHCLNCHDAKEAEGKLVMETYASLMKGGEDGPAIIPGKANESPLIQQVEHKEKPFMPPPKKGDQLSPEEIALLRRWINLGAQGPVAGEDVAVARALPKVDPKTAPRRAVNAMAYDAKSKLLALAVLNEIELRLPENQATVTKLGPHTGHVNSLAFTADGTKLIAASGAPGVAGEVTIWNVADGKQLKRFTGHKDAIYAVAISADGKTLATGSYDQKIILWNEADGTALRTLEGHNGAVFDVAFRPDGKVLASASADRTVKLWDVATGKRLDTRSEPTKEQQTLVFSPDGGKLYAAGADNRVRVWRIGPQAIEGSNPLLLSQFAAEGTVLRLAISQDGKTLATAADDKTVKLWDAEKLELKVALEPQSDWPAAVAFALNSKVVSVGRLDGTVGYYDSSTGKAIPPPKPELTNLEPRGVQRGHSVKVKLSGKDVLAATSLKIAGNDKLSAKIVTGERGMANIAWAQIEAAADAPLGAFDLVAVGPGGASAAAKFVVDDLPQVEETEKGGKSASGEYSTAATLPVTFGGSFGARGDVDTFAFEGKAGQTIVIDVAAKRFASKADPVMTLFDPAGRPLGMSADDYADADPLLVRTLPADGRYTIRVNDLLGATTPLHYYRMSVGAFAYATGCFPLAVAPSRESDVRLIGYNLSDGASAKVKAPASGEVPLSLDSATYRTRRAINVMVGGAAETVEVEPNDAPAQATKITLGSGVSGRFDEKPGGDVDLYRFAAKAGQSIVVETQAAQRGSAADTKVEVLWSDGRPVERVQLQAVRDSWITFRPIDANVVGARLNSWEEMELNQYLYLQGEVVKLHLYPRGPDSEFNFYPMGGRRRTYFDTSPTAHALEEKCYIVQPHKPGEMLSANGLPVFKLNYVNDDDSLRQLGADSRLLFTAPADGSYLVRVTDTRSFGGPRFTYRLLVRDARPDFLASVEGLNPSIPSGSGRNFVVRVNRIDGFDGAVKVDLTGVAAPFTISTPIVIEAGHVEAQGTIFATPSEIPATTRPVESAAIKVTASATVEGKSVTKPLADLPKLTVGGKPLLTVSLTPIDPKQSAITVQPGQRVPAMLRVKRGTYKGLVSFEVENLPHGVLVSDIGLSGVLIPDGQDERQIFIQCAPWVSNQTRPCHARALQGDNPTSPPVMLIVGERIVGQAN
ncbi:MAG: repeat-containing protein [Phycisphaerales bacterium]|nr:repeat-containing protein [Phycisphaerales bacterium]